MEQSTKIGDPSSDETNKHRENLRDPMTQNQSKLTISDPM